MLVKWPEIVCYLCISFVWNAKTFMIYVDISFDFEMKRKKENKHSPETALIINEHQGKKK